MEFYQCLHRIHTDLSNRIGELYFNTQAQCYRNDYKILDCREYDTVNYTRRCIHYLLLLMTPIENQWFDLPFYSGKLMKTPLFQLDDQ